jgi:hypothetical protein
MNRRDRLDLDYLPRRLRRTDAAEYLRRVHGIDLAPTTLAAYAVKSGLRGNGPAYRKIRNRPLYSLKDLDAWARARLGPRVNSNTQLRGGTSS